MIYESMIYFIFIYFFRNSDVLWLHLFQHCKSKIQSAPYWMIYRVLFS